MAEFKALSILEASKLLSHMETFFYSGEKGQPKPWSLIT